MILRRIREHVTHHNWFAVAVDFVIVVIGVFVGIQASNWNQARIQRQQAREYRAMLLNDLDENLANLETPGYKRLDVAPAFESQLSQAMQSGDARQIASVQPELSIDTHAVSNRADGNTVQLENELLKLNQNMVDHALETQLVTSSMLRLRCSRRSATTAPCTGGCSRSRCSRTRRVTWSSGRPGSTR